jgi:hypothetical protein
LKSNDAETVAETVYRELICRYEVPVRILTEWIFHQQAFPQTAKGSWMSIN